MLAKQGHILFVLLEVSRADERERTQRDLHVARPHICRRKPFSSAQNRRDNSENRRSCSDAVRAASRRAPSSTGVNFLNDLLVIGFFINRSSQKPGRLRSETRTLKARTGCEKLTPRYLEARYQRSSLAPIDATGLSPARGRILSVAI